MPFDSFPTSIPPVDAELVDKIVSKLKTQGIFDQFRKDCLADVDTKPAYQNLQQRVNGTVATFLGTQQWQPDLNKTQLRETLRKYVQQGFLEVGVDRIVDQVVNPKIVPLFMPKVEDVVCDCLGIEKPKIPLSVTLSTQFLTSFPPPLPRPNPNTPPKVVNLFPKGLDPFSPESDHNCLNGGDTPLKDERNNNDSPGKEDDDNSQLSGISDLSSHVGDSSFRENPIDSNTIKSIASPKPEADALQFDNFSNLTEKIKQAEMSHGQVSGPQNENPDDDMSLSELTGSSPKEIKEETTSEEVKFELMSNNSVSTFEDSKTFVTNKLKGDSFSQMLSEDDSVSSNLIIKEKVENSSKPFDSESSNMVIGTQDNSMPQEALDNFNEIIEQKDDSLIDKIQVKEEIKLTKKDDNLKDKKSRDSSSSSKHNRSSDKHRPSDSKHCSGYDKKDEKSRDRSNEKDRSNREDKDGRLLKENKSDRSLKEDKGDRSLKEDKGDRSLKEDKGDRTLKEDKGDRSLKEDKGDRSLKEDKGDRILKEDKGDRSLKEEKGDRSLKEDKGDRSLKEDKGDRILKENKGDRSLKEDKGDRSLKEDKGDRSLKEDKGDRSLKEDKGDRSLKEDKGDRSLKEDKGDRLLKEDKGDRSLMEDKGDRSLKENKSLRDYKSDRSLKDDKGERSLKEDKGDRSLKEDKNRSSLKDDKYRSSHKHETSSNRNEKDLSNKELKDKYKNDEKDRGNTKDKEKSSIKDESIRSSQKDDKTKYKDEKHCSSKDRNREKEKSEKNKDDTGIKRDFKTESKDVIEKEKKEDGFVKEREHSSSRSKYDQNKEKEQNSRNKLEYDKEKRDKIDRDKNDRDHKTSEKENDKHYKDRYRQEKGRKQDKEKEGASDEKSKSSKKRESKCHDRSNQSSSGKKSEQKTDDLDKKSKTDESRNNTDKNKTEDEKKDRKRKGERCKDEVKQKDPRRSSDRDSSGSKGSSNQRFNSETKSTSSQSTKPSSSDKKSRGSTSNTNSKQGQSDSTDQVDSYFSGSNRSSDHLSNGTSDIDTIMSKLNSSINEDIENAGSNQGYAPEEIPLKKPKIAKNFSEIRKIMQARKNIDRKFKNDLKVPKDINELNTNTNEETQSCNVIESEIPEENKENIKNSEFEKTKTLKNSNNINKWFVGFSEPEVEKSINNFIIYEHNAQVGINRTMYTDNLIDHYKQEGMVLNEDLLDNNLNKVKPRMSTLVERTEAETILLESAVNGKNRCYVLLNQDCPEIAKHLKNLPMTEAGEPSCEDLRKTGLEMREETGRVEVKTGGHVDLDLGTSQVQVSPVPTHQQDSERGHQPQDKEHIDIQQFAPIISELCSPRSPEADEDKGLSIALTEDMLNNLMKESMMELDGDMVDSDSEEAAETKEIVFNEHNVLKRKDKLDDSFKESREIFPSVKIKDNTIKEQNKEATPKSENVQEEKGGPPKPQARRLSRSSQRYSSTDLYKPRPVLPQNTKRVRSSISGSAEETSSIILRGKRDRSEPLLKKKRTR